MSIGQKELDKARNERLEQMAIIGCYLREARNIDNGNELSMDQKLHVVQSALLLRIANALDNISMTLSKSKYD